MSRFLRITAHWSLGGSNSAVNTWHFSADGAGIIFGPTQSDIENQADAAIQQLKTMYNAVAVAGLAGAWIIGDVVTEHQTGQPPKYVNATSATSTVSPGTLDAYQLAGVTSWKTGLAGRSYRGRTFWGPLKSSAFSKPDLSSGWVTSVNAATAAFLAAPTGGDLVPCVYSPTLDQTTAIVSGLTSTACRTMRSRAS